MAKSMSAANLVGLLAARHANDVFVSECKNGPTHSSANLLRLDGWAMRKSWAHYGTVGYEVKVSRADFEQDQKFVGYLDYCHEFYFVCPAGLIKAAELPKGVGLMWASANGEKLFIKHRAEHRKPDPEKLLELMSYVLMCRVRIVRDMHAANSDGGEPFDKDAVYRKWVADAEAKKELACCVNQHVRSRFFEQGERIKSIDAQVKMVEEVKLHLAGLGIEWPPSDWGVWNVIRQIDELAGKLPPHLRHTIANAERALKSVGQAIDELEGRGKEAAQEGSAAE